jgi:serine/threonine protein kinase/Tfp pilus assembly protein PilF
MIEQTISHYRILSKLGEGGMGVVYLAEDTLLGRRVALKMLNATVTPGKQHFRIRFLREARSVSTLNHPHIATIYDYGETLDGQPYIVMELVNGKLLSDLLRDGALTLNRAVEIIKEIAEALAEAHRHGIVHRDIKPSNVAINERGQVKVLDFGLAKQLNDVTAQASDPEMQMLLNTQTREGMVIGTPMYLSPEQAMGVSIDERSDLFSLGSLLYECIAGVSAFSGTSPVEICAKVIRDDPPPPSRFNPLVSPELDRIALKALAKRTDVRYQSADEMISDLNAVHSLLQKHGVDHAATKRLQPAPGTIRSGALSTLSDIFNRPRLSISYLALGMLVAGLLAFIAWQTLRPKPHQPTIEAQRLYEIGVNALREGTYYRASKTLERAVAADNKYALAHARYAEALMELDDADKAKDELLSVSRLVPDRSILPHEERLYLDAITETIARDFASAIKSYTEIANLKPTEAQAYLDLGHAYENNEEIDKAIESYVKATNLDPNNAAAFLKAGILYGRKRDLANASMAFDKANSLYKDSTNFEGGAEVFYQRGYLLSQIGTLPEAREQSKKALEIAKLGDNKYQQIRALLQLSGIDYSAGDTAQAKQYATEAVELAKANDMENLTTQGLLDLGYAFFVRRAYDDAEQYFKEALDFAQRYKGRRNEARANWSLGSLYIQQEEPDKGLPYIEQALNFYRNGGYQKEISRCLIMSGRAKLLKGDFEAALKVFEEQLQTARQVGDQAQVARSQAEIGAEYAKQELYPQALDYFEYSYSLNQSLSNPLNAAFSLLNQADMFARLGRDPEARAALEQLPSFTERLSSDNNNKQVYTAWSYLIAARIALSERNFSEAKIKSQQALSAITAQNQNTLAIAKATLGLSQALSGSNGEGKKLCQEAVAIAAQTGDLRLLADTRLVLAETLLESGDAKDALTTALQAQENFARSHKQESEWRAWLIAGRASQRLHNYDAMRQQLLNAHHVLENLEKDWGAEAFLSYSSRLDVNRYQGQLNFIAQAIK